MAKLTRVTGKVFGGSAPLDEIGQFGSALAGNPTNTQDVATIQALDAYSKGWGSAVISSRQFPPIEEVTGALKTISYQGCYLLQEGIPEYDIDTEYSNTSIVKSINDGITTLYVSLSNGNKGNALSNATYWKPYVLDRIQRNIGEIVTSTIPLTDAGLHLLDGALLQYGSYQAFINYIAGLVTDYPDLFVTEADWQTAVTNYGVCGKYVYDSVNNTVRLPRVTGKIEGTIDVSALGDLAAQYVKLPNITASTQFADGFSTDRRVRIVNNSGAFTTTSSSATFGNSRDTSNINAAHTLGFDASRSSSVYSGNGSDTKIHEQAIKGFMYVVIATSTKTDIEVDIDEIATDLNGKADTDLTNTTNTGYIKMAGASMPSNTYVNLTLGASGTTYTAPANGWFNFQITTSSVGNVWGQLQCRNIVSSSFTNVGWAVAGIIPVNKGDIVNYQYNIQTTLASHNLYFIYAKGSESEAQ